MERVDTVAFVKEQKQTICHELENLCTLSDEAAKKQKIDEMFVKADQVKKYVHQHIPAMIAYEIRVCNNLIKEIDSAISRKREVAASKPFKFSFNLKASTKSKPVESSLSVIPSVDADQIDAKPFPVSRVNVGLSNLTGEERTLNSSEIDQNEIVLESLVDCTIYLQGAPSALRLLNLEGCKIFTGPVSGSVFLANCHNCQMNLIGQQLRIHDTSDCDIYQHVRSRSIIENCTRLRFGCYNWTYHKLEDDFFKAGIDSKVNNWTQIDDFNCLTNPSPNWCIIENNHL